MKVALAGLDLDDPTDRTVVIGLAGGLRARGHEAVLVGPRRRLAQPVRETWRGFLVRRLSRASELLELQREQGFDVWHCLVFGRSQAALARAVERGRFPVVATLYLVSDYLASARGLNRLLRRAHHVTADCAFGLAQARARFPFIARRSSVVHNGLPAIEAESRGGGGLPTGPYALCASRLAPYKGLDLLFMAFARLRERAPGLKLVVCGGDQLRGGLESFTRVLRIESAVRFVGQVGRPRLKRLLDRCLFFTLPSRRENLPLVLLEAMAAGKPVVAARVGGVPEVVTDGRDGLLVEPGDVDGLVEAMGMLVADAGLRGALGRRARLKVRAFDWGKAARRYEELYARARG